ncbi:BTB/POZ and TAZ domain-containing protein 2 [Arabidopsis lyrata subsp. lyrata]|uniref:BTB/POZ and TAZ domain-containing protein 2 n=1 Tax=Arabidopsis lyrata subsp. lyrata TaxID=81972 RepID=UPI000A29A445|nr:BTB/POZ and TAZ domain-containing protein 2 [Arabidopsis lyrata subsp. lyrata]|eukprot:XP_020880370.1 BTB/POZ and TAZ domain-containing protein 2 [Arabidopsis lyrata subsp. lyrata]
MEAVLVAMSVPATTEDDGFSLITDKLSYNLTTTSDVEIVTSSNRRIPAHSGVLASASPVLMNIMKKPVRRYRGCGSKRVIKILGVPCDAVSVLIKFLYSSSLTEDEMERHGIHLLALSHVYMVTQLKQRCSKGVVQRLTTENVVDVLQLARLCDAPDVCLRSMRLIHLKFKTVEQTEGWKFIQEHDPFLELDILQFIDDAESRKKRRRRHRKEQDLYMQLSEAMECIEHICTQGCTLVGPSNVVDNNKSMIAEKSKPCKAFSTCYGLQLLIRHFAVCKRRNNDKGCLRCKRMLQLFRLHSLICDQPDSCRVPLCRQFKKRGEQDKKMGEDTKWKLLVTRVVSAKAMSSLCQSKKNKREEAHEQEGAC